MALYAEIQAINAPAEATPGTRVDITVRVKNLHSAPVYMTVSGVFFTGESLDINFPEQRTLNAGESYNFPGWFTMPYAHGTIYAWSWWYGSDEQFHLDDEKTKDVNMKSYVGWVEAAITYIYVDRAEETWLGWHAVAEGTLAVERAEETWLGWHAVAEATIHVMREGETFLGWWEAAVKTISVSRPGEDELDGKEFPWGTALLAAGGVVALASIIPKKGVVKTPVKGK